MAEAETPDFIVIDDVSKVFPDGTGLHPTSMSIARGEFISVVGPSGCGKSTLLRCLAGLARPDSGRITINHELVFDSSKRVNLSPNRRNLSMVFQDLALWPHMTVRHIVEFPLTCGKNKPSAQQRAARVDEALELVGISEKASQRPDQLSGGQQQRVAIARALVSRPGLMLLDEPLSALDPALSIHIRDELVSLSRELNLTMVYVTHDQHEALSMSDRVVVMDQGNVVLCQAGRGL